jgi:hypothetical protein
MIDGVVYHQIIFKGHSRENDLTIAEVSNLAACGMNVLFNDVNSLHAYTCCDMEVAIRSHRRDP